MAKTLFFIYSRDFNFSQFLTFKLQFSESKIYVFLLRMKRLTRKLRTIPAKFKGRSAIERMSLLMDVYTPSIDKSAVVSFLFSRKAPFSPSQLSVSIGAIESFAQGPYCTLEPFYRDDTFLRNVATIPAI